MEEANEQGCCRDGGGDVDDAGRRDDGDGLGAGEEARCPRDGVARKADRAWDFVAARLGGGESKDV